MIVVIILFGLIVGSFLTAFTYRYPRGISILSNDRSRCPNCEKIIHWYDNIPLFSYLILLGKCRNCKASISLRYPLTEGLTAALFGLTYYLLNRCGVGETVLCTFQKTLGTLPALSLTLIILSILIAIFIIDLEHMIIPDSLVFFLLGIFTIVLMLFFPEAFYLSFFSGFIAALFLLVLNFMTRGHGMGLGDVKFAVVGGMLVPGLATLSWMMLSFLIGGAIGTFLLLSRNVLLKSRVPFGPFLVVALILTLFFGTMEPINGIWGM